MATDRPLTALISADRTPPSLKAYEKAGGYHALRKALQSMSPDDVTQVVTDSGLRGRGGAGFPTGRKWQFIPMEEGYPKPKYLIANADEMEPGTFKDRLLLEGNPHLLLEGMMIAAYAVQANVAYVFLRWAYRQAAQNITRAISEAYEAGYLGQNILGSGYDLDIHLHVSAGRYICGEATALLNALEGERPIPRAKPPHAANAGLHSKPTVVNNVETLCNVAPIVEWGADWFKGLSLTDDAGTKLFQVSGRVKNPGVWELPMGTPLRQIVEEQAGGMQDGVALRGLLPGGASTEFLLPEHLDVKMDFASVKEVGSRFGTATIVILDDHTCPIGMLENVMRYFARESCGWCTPCRDGLAWVTQALTAFEEGHAETRDLDALAQHAELIRGDRTFCGLATGAIEPLRSGLTYFEADFKRHIQEKRCPWR